MIKRFRWWRFCPDILFFAGGIAALCLPAAGTVPVAIALGVLFALSGVLTLVAFFFGLTENVLSLLSGVGRLSVAVWLFAVRSVPVGVLGVALAILLALLAGENILTAVKERERGKALFAVRVALFAASVAMPVVLVAAPLSRETTMYLAGAAMMLLSVLGMIFTLLTGAFEPEEELHFKPVKR